MVGLRQDPVRMTVHVDKAGGDDPTGAIDATGRLSLCQIANCSDLVPFYPDRH